MKVTLKYVLIDVHRIFYKLTNTQTYDHTYLQTEA